MAATRARRTAAQPGVAPGPAGLGSLAWPGRQAIGKDTTTGQAHWLLCTQNVFVLHFGLPTAPARRPRRIFARQLPFSLMSTSRRGRGRGLNPLHTGYRNICVDVMRRIHTLDVSKFLSDVLPTLLIVKGINISDLLFTPKTSLFSVKYFAK